MAGYKGQGGGGGNKRMKCALYVLAFIIFQVGVIAIISVTIMKVKTPKFRVSSSALLDTSNLSPQATSPTLKMITQFTVKNPNFGPYQFDSTTVNFYYNSNSTTGNQFVGSVAIHSAKAGFYSTKKIDVEVDASIPASAQGDLNSGIVTLTSQGQLTGKVKLMYLLKKKKVINLSCSMDVNTKTKEVQNINCN